MVLAADERTPALARLDDDANEHQNYQTHDCGLTAEGETSEIMYCSRDSQSWQLRIDKALTVWHRSCSSRQLDWALCQKTDTCDIRRISSTTPRTFLMCSVRHAVVTSLRRWQRAERVGTDLVTQSTSMFQKRPGCRGSTGKPCPRDRVPRFTRAAFCARDRLV